MSTISTLLDEFERLCESEENKRRLSLWDTSECGIRGETQWHSVPGYSVRENPVMPVTAECLEKIWQDILGLDLAKYHTDPEYFLEYHLKIRLKKFKEFPDDTPLTRDIPVCFGVTHEAGMLGQKVYLDTGEEPSFAKEAVVDENTDFSRKIDFNNNEYLAMVLPFYNKVKQLSGKDYNVIFPAWYRGPQGTALYIRGFQNLSMDLYLNPEFVHRLLRYVTDTQKEYEQWKAEYTGVPIAKADLFNDDIPIMSPEAYKEFFFPYEQELSDFYGGVYYWHSCGDVTKHVPEIEKLSSIDIFDFGVTMENKLAGIENLTDPNKAVLELRVFAKPHVQECTEEESKEYVRQILQNCREKGIRKYVIRSSGMSIVLGAENDVKKLGRWVELVREVQEEA